MKRICFILWATVVMALFEPPPPAEAQVGTITTIRCNGVAIQAASTASLATLVAGVAGKTIHLCGWHVTSSAGTASTFTLSSGTGTNCASTNVAITPAFNVTSTAPSADHNEAAWTSLAIGNNLCIVSSTTSLQVLVWYGQY